MTIQDITEIIRRIVKKYIHIGTNAANRYTDKSRFIDDLEGDSEAICQIINSLEKRFKIKISDANARNINSVKQAANYVFAHQVN